MNGHSQVYQNYMEDLDREIKEAKSEALAEATKRHNQVFARDIEGMKEDILANTLDGEYYGFKYCKLGDHYVAGHKWGLSNCKQCELNDYND